jgi:hypothetical protein
VLLLRVKRDYPTVNGPATPPFSDTT